MRSTSGVVALQSWARSRAIVVHAVVVLGSSGTCLLAMKVGKLLRSSS